MPAGIAYAVAAARDAARRAGRRPSAARPVARLRRAGARASGRRTAAASTSRGSVILSEGPSAAGWWEHERLARELCAPVVTLADLEQRDGRRRGVDRRAHRAAIDVVYLRTDEDRFRDEHGTPTAVGEALLGPAAAGTLAVVNAPGSGIADDKLVHAHVDELVRLYLDQEPLLPSIPARLLGPDDDLDDLVVKPRGEMGGEGVVIWRDADARHARARARADRRGARRLDRPGARGAVGSPDRRGRWARAAPRGPAPLRAPVRRRPACAAGGHQPRGARARLDGGEQRAGRWSEGHLGAQLHRQSGISAARMCSVPSQCSRISRRRGRCPGGAAAATSRLCCAFEWLSTSFGCATRWIRSLIWPWTSVIAATSRGEWQASASPMWKRTSARRYTSKPAAWPYAHVAR